MPLFERRQDCSPSPRAYHHRAIDMYKQKAGPNRWPGPLVLTGGTSDGRYAVIGSSRIDRLTKFFIRFTLNPLWVSGAVP